MVLQLHDSPSTAAPNAARRFADRLLLVAVTLLLALPFADWALDLQPGQRQWERRPLVLAPAAPATAAEAAQWPRDAERWVDDHIGLRRSFIQWWNGANLVVLAHSPVDHVIVGADGWLFDGTPAARACYDGTPLPAQLRDGWVRAVTLRRDWCAARALRYCLVIVPMKAGVHGEAYPGEVAERGAGRQLLDALRPIAGLHVVDAGAALREHGTRAELFHRRDHHWNARGVHVVLDAIAAATNVPGLARPAYDEVRFTEHSQTAGDLARQLALESVWSESVPVPEIDGLPPVRRLHARSGSPAAAQLFVTDRADLPHVVLLGDSFTLEMRTHLAPRCRRLVALRVQARRPSAWGGGAWLEAERPEWVIDVVRASTLWLAPEAPGR